RGGSCSTSLVRTVLDAARGAGSYHRKPAADGRALDARHHAVLRRPRREARDVPRSFVGVRGPARSLCERAEAPRPLARSIDEGGPHWLIAWPDVTARLTPGRSWGKLR